jgi:hypothetical protein
LPDPCVDGGGDHKEFFFYNRQCASCCQQLIVCTTNIIKSTEKLPLNAQQLQKVGCITVGVQTGLRLGLRCQAVNNSRRMADPLNLPDAHSKFGVCIGSIKGSSAWTGITGITGPCRMASI